MVLYSGVCRTVLHTSELSDLASDDSDLISAMNDSRSLVANMRSEPSNARYDGSDVRSTVLGSSLDNTNPNPKSVSRHYPNPGTSGHLYPKTSVSLFSYNVSRKITQKTLPERDYCANLLKLRGAERYRHFFGTKYLTCIRSRSHVSKSACTSVSVQC
ncbi:hypothetical protein RHMOL_Rhmol03G0206500 [Rhododendron molle]|uniref:Uncharacterized protein n=1 Tax=Rhododendron molle TaxID=49168 RepID=A0ACC0PHZ8_RHOML|nr:hypothetical protein RHMOL_Rhmol03G0206500 [Rhododendron molle]